MDVRRWRPWELPAVAWWYLAVIWSLFLVVAVVDFEGRRELADPFGYSISDLSSNAPRALVVLPVAPFVNVGVLQILYVTAILSVVTPRLVEREGATVTAGVFLGTSVAGALAAGVALHVADSQLEHAILDEAWARSWNGGSAGCYGLAGLLAAGTRRPFVGLGAVAAWEVGLAAVHLHSWTPAFHLSALVTGFAMGIIRRTEGRWEGWKIGT